MKCLRIMSTKTSMALQVVDWSSNALRDLAQAYPPAVIHAGLVASRPLPKFITSCFAPIYLL